MPGRQLPRPEHPRSQFFRPAWISLNGAWTYAFELSDGGIDAGCQLQMSTRIDREIMVRFCPESRLSGVEYTDFIPAMWYHKTIDGPASWERTRVLLHFGAVDYECEAFVDDASVGTHFGGTVSFTFDITSNVSAGSSYDRVVRVKDDTRAGNQARGTQPHLYESDGVFYTRTTGVWQRVSLVEREQNGIYNYDCSEKSDMRRIRDIFSVSPPWWDTEAKGVRT